MANQEIRLTAEGYQKTLEELEYLKTVKRGEIAEKIEIARSFGDLSENSEYDEAKNEQAIMESRSRGPMYSYTIPRQPSTLTIP